MSSDRFETARGVADAVLYEGYVLYPYRASSAKNQMRWQFGVLAPNAYVDANPYERASIRTECIVDPGAAPALCVRVRCLQVQRRTVEALVAEGYVSVPSLAVDGTALVPWDEAIEHRVDTGPIPLLPLERARTTIEFVFPAGVDTEAVTTTTAGGTCVAGRIVRTREEVRGTVATSAQWAEGPGALVKVTVTVTNTTRWSPDSPTAAARRDDVLPMSLVAVHTMLAVDDGTFLSVIDPPDDARDAAAHCTSDGTFPVLVGDSDDVVLSSPIILYDHPELAPESPGELYDSTEIDEILALRVLTLTDDEKAQARGTDARAAAIIDRVDAMTPDRWERLHGAIRAIERAEPAADVEDAPWWDPGMDAAVNPSTDEVMVAGVPVRQGSPVRLQPSRRADAHDIFLAGLDATVTGVFTDVDGNTHVAVTIDDDPAAAEFGWQGRYYYFAPEEIVPRNVEEHSR